MRSSTSGASCLARPSTPTAATYTPSAIAAATRWRGSCGMVRQATMDERVVRRLHLAVDHERPVGPDTCGHGQARQGHTADLARRPSFEGHHGRDEPEEQHEEVLPVLGLPRDEDRTDDDEQWQSRHEVEGPEPAFRHPCRGGGPITHSGRFEQPASGSSVHGRAFRREQCPLSMRIGGGPSVTLCHLFCRTLSRRAVTSVHCSRDCASREIGP